MKVDLKYAEQHFEELLDAVENGEEVLMTRPDKPLIALIKSTDDPA